MPPETEESHFDPIIKPFAEKLGMDIKTFNKGYCDGSIIEPLLDEYFIHDRAVRESGHDTTYRLEGKCANIIPVDLNCLLYKYECDFAEITRMFPDEDWTHNHNFYVNRSRVRKELIDKYLWNNELGIYLDYDLKLEEQNNYVSSTMFYALWCGVCSQQQAEKVARYGLPPLEFQGGLVSGTLESRGPISVSRPNR